jgi:hypothetical protein
MKKSMMNNRREDKRIGGKDFTYEVYLRSMGTCWRYVKELK